MCNQVSISRWRNLEVPCGSTLVQKFLFPTEQTLQQAKEVNAIVAYRQSDVSNGSETGAALVSDAVFSRSFLVLVNGSDEVVSKIPLVELNPRQNNGQIRKFVLPELNGRKTFDVTKSYIFTANTTGLATGTVWLLSFEYKS